jgi:hypothetical protein
VRWNVAKAKQKLSELIRASRGRPQLIFSRERLVAAMVSPETLEELQHLKDQQRGTLADAFTELSRLCEKEDYVLEAPPRADRPNSFVHAVGDAGRHKRPQ